MTWTEDSVLEACDRVGLGGTLWILYLAGNTDVGIGKTSDYHTLRNSVRAYAKRQGLEEPDHPTIKNGYENISQKVVVDADGNKNTINNEKRNHLVSLTSLGKGMMKEVHHDDQTRAAVKESIGIETDEPIDPWWPEDGPRESFEVFLHTYTDRSVLKEEESEIEARAIFDCARCGEEVKNSFQVTLVEGHIVDGWSKFPKAECTNCNTEYKHSAADPHREPEPLD